MATRQFLATHPEIFSLSYDRFAGLWNRIVDRHMAQPVQCSFLDKGVACMKELFHKAGFALSHSEASQNFQMYMGYYQRHWRLFPDVLSCLEELKHLPLGIISNADRQQQHGKLEQLGIKERFAPIVLSAEVGIAKPDARIFETACQLANSSPAQCIYVGDHFELDALASARAGMHAIWLAREQNMRAAPGVIVIDSLRSLAEAIASIS